MNYKLNKDDFYDEFIDEKNYNLLKSALKKDFNFKKIYHNSGPNLRIADSLSKFLDIIQGRKNLLYFIEICGKKVKQVGFYHKIDLKKNYVKSYFDNDSFILEFDTNSILYTKKDKDYKEHFTTSYQNFFCVGKDYQKWYNGIEINKYGNFDYYDVYSYDLTSNQLTTRCSYEYITDYIVYQIEENFYLK